MDARLVRRAEAGIIYKGKEISTSLSPYLKNITIVDNLKGSIDDLNITLRNDEYRFLQPGWSFELKDRLEISLATVNWENELEGKKSLKCGYFYLDDKSFNKDTVTIKGLSIPLGPIQDQKNSKHWDNASLETIGKEIAAKYKLKFMYLVKEKINFYSVDQSKETDLEFLNKIASDEGINLKLTFDKLVLFDEAYMEDEKTERIIDLRGGEVIDWDIREKTKDIYDKVEINYFDSTSGEDETYTYSERKNKVLPQKILKITRRSASRSLEKLAKKRLKQINQDRIILNLSIVGELALAAGKTFNLINAGIFNGKYMINKLTRTLSPFTTNIEAYYIKKED